MQIIFGRENAEELRSKYTILDLEKIEQDGNEFEVFCLIPADKIPIDEMPKLESWINLHHDFLKGYENKEYNYCKQCMEHLRGKFGGEVDSFYDEIEKRINEAEAADGTLSE